MKNHKQGFTLIEMLVVIAVIAVLVSIVIPVVSTPLTKAKAATDAANLRSALGSMNTEIILNSTITNEYVQSLKPTESRLYPGCALYAVFDDPAFVDVYFVDTTTGEYYGLLYMSDISTNGTTDREPDPPVLSGAAEWYIVGVGKVS